MAPPTFQAPQRRHSALRGRLFSFAPEFYGLFVGVHWLVNGVFGRVFPNPLAVSAWALRRQGLRGRGWRGTPVEGAAAGVGRMVGRHPVSGAPVVAWNAEAYEAMCEAFDQENAARIVAWQRGSARLALSTEACLRWALRVDRGLRGMVALCVLASVAWGWLATGVLVQGLLWSIGGLGVGLVLLLLVAVVGLLAVSLAGGGVALAVGLWGARQARQARVSDEDGRTSAAAIVAAMQQP